jgi:hypothetical protein
MTTIPHVATTMQRVLSTTADAAAQHTRFVQRPRKAKLMGSTFVQTLVFGWLADPDASLDSLAQTAAALGVPITPQALDQRFTPAAAACLETVLSTAMRCLIAATPVAIPILDRFTAVYAQDSSTIVLPDALAAVWHGCGGSSELRTQAALKLQVRLDLRTGQLHGPQLQHGRASDHAAALPSVLPAGALRLADLGYWRLDDLDALASQQVFWLSRLHTGTAIYDTDGQRRDVFTWLKAQNSPLVDLPIRLGTTHQLAARMVAVRVPQEVADQRRRQLRATARRKGRAVNRVCLALANWTILVTNVPPELLNVQEALVLARARWQIELLFKLWKSYRHIDTSRSGKPWRVLCEVYAKLLAMVVQHWLLLVGCWAYPDRSLLKAAQTVRKHALHLASAFRKTAHLTRAIATIHQCLAVGCRLNRRKKAPNTSQLLLALTDVPALA